MQTLGWALGDLDHGNVDQSLEETVIGGQLENETNFYLCRFSM